MFSMTKSKELDEVQSEDGDVNKRYYGEDVKFDHTFFPISFLYLNLSSLKPNHWFKHYR